MTDASKSISLTFVPLSLTDLLERLDNHDLDALVEIGELSEKKK